MERLAGRRVGRQGGSSGHEEVLRSAACCAAGFSIHNTVQRRLQSVILFPILIYIPTPIPIPIPIFPLCRNITQPVSCAPKTARSENSQHAGFCKQSWTSRQIASLSKTTHALLPARTQTSSFFKVTLPLRYTAGFAGWSPS